MFARLDENKASDESLKIKTKPPFGGHAKTRRNTYNGKKTDLPEGFRKARGR